MSDCNCANETIIKKWVETLCKAIVSPHLAVEQRHSASITMSEVVNLTQSDPSISDDAREHVRQAYLQALRSYNGDTLHEASILISRMLADLHAWERRYSQRFDVLSITPLVKGHLEMLYETLLDKRPHYEAFARK
jgi:hypothetical protein